MSEEEWNRKIKECDLAHDRFMALYYKFLAKNTLRGGL